MECPWQDWRVKSNGPGSSDVPTVVLALQMRRPRTRTPTSVDLSFNWAGPSAADALASSLLERVSSSTGLVLRSLRLNGNRFGSDGTAALCSAIEQSTTLQTVSGLVLSPAAFDRLATNSARWDRRRALSFFRFAHTFYCGSRDADQSGPDAV